MTYTLKVSDNNGTDTYGPFKTHREATKERTSIILAYDYNKAHGFTRENDGNTVYFRHAFYSTVIFDIIRN